MTAELVAAARAGLAELADAGKAPQMQRYMKSAMPFRGVPAPARRKLANRLFRAYPLADVAEFTAVTRQLWREAGYREERYLAIDLTGHGAYRGWQSPGLLELYEELIVTGAWWDYVDEVAIRRIGPLLRTDPGVLKPVLLDWAADEDHWRRRTAIICQIGAKSATDTGLLTQAIEASIGEPDFFLRKAIGWALRELAKTDPDWVLAFAENHGDLSPLSRREALKNLKN
ncbi:DNA alkylation repair protein [Amycolatopsis albispora]|uniref:DNA alkylation repair protein n=1 Tax=Amycolatopsis albispora TaxID=1804986 RepID=A0A344L6A0_9PSEU|nr:DNA alkylation repair protein [Amycolatopsis albispora]AXB43574.1 DNA alkylation repair protein [Amycolatopsis albispora]